MSYICPNKWTTPREDLNVNYGFGVMVSHCRLISCNKCTIYEKMLIMAEAIHTWDWRCVSISDPSTQFDYDPKITLNNRVYY